MTSSPGRLFVQTVLPAERQLALITGDELYRHDGQTFPPRRNTGSAPECRIEVSPSQPSETDFFLHVLTAADAGTEIVPRATARVETGRVQVELARTKLAFNTVAVGGEITWRGQATKLAQSIQLDPSPPIR